MLKNPNASRLIKNLEISIFWMKNKKESFELFMPFFIDFSSASMHSAVLHFKIKACQHKFPDLEEEQILLMEKWN